jgi:hypothetical protein
MSPSLYRTLAGDSGAGLNFCLADFTKYRDQSRQNRWRYNRDVGRAEYKVDLRRQRRQSCNGRGMRVKTGFGAIQLDGCRIGCVAL